MCALDSQPDRLLHERRYRAAGHVRIAGVDEAGRGPLAGPVVAAAVVLPADWIDTALPGELRSLNDSKQVSESRREAFFELLTARPEIGWSVAEVDAATIDRINILKATHLAMRNALAGLPDVPDHVLVDGHAADLGGRSQTAIIKGDALSYSIAAASILAKVTRDRLMRRLHEAHPQYGFAQHKGYGTRAHLDAIARHGPCPAHRMTFAPCQVELPMS